MNETGYLKQAGYSYPVLNVPDAVEKGFPEISKGASLIFVLEIAYLQAIWNDAQNRTTHNEYVETEYKNSLGKKIIDNTTSVYVVGSLSTLGALACIISGAVLKVLPLCITGGAILSFAVPAALSPCCYSDKTSSISQTRVNLSLQRNNIELCIKLMNSLDALSEAWEKVKVSATKANIIALFEIFQRVQMDEIGITIKNIKELDKLHLMDNICAAKSVTDQMNNLDHALIQEWKKFVINPEVVSLATWDPIDPIGFPNLAANRSAYLALILNRKEELQVDVKISALKKYINNNMMRLYPPVGISSAITLMLNNP